MKTVCSCGAPATVRVPCLDEWVCQRHAIEYYTGLVAVGAALFQTGCWEEMTTKQPQIAQRKSCVRCPVEFISTGLETSLCPWCRSRSARLSVSHRYQDRRAGAGT